MSRFTILFVVLAVVAVDACGSSQESGEVTIAVGGGPVTVSDGNLEISIRTVRDRGDTVATSSGTLSVDATKRDTHTIFEFPLTSSVIAGDQWGLAFEALVLSSGDGDVDTAFICSDSFCGGETSSFGVFSGSDGEFTVYAVAPSGVESFTVGFTGAVTWPPSGSDGLDGSEAPTPAETVVEVDP